jgi:hypothetical protein
MCPFGEKFCFGNIIPAGTPFVALFWEAIKWYFGGLVTTKAWKRLWIIVFTL